MNKNIFIIYSLLTIILFSGCTTVDRGNFPQMLHLDSSLAYKNSYDVIDTSKEDIGMPKPPVSIVERFEVVDGGCAYRDCGELRDSGSSGDRERKELKVPTHNRDTNDGDEFWYTWSIYFPKNYKSIVPAQSTFGQWHAKSCGVQYMFIEDYGYRIKMPILGRESPKFLIRDEDLRGKWHTIKVHAKWSSDSEKGFFKVWVNNKLKFENYTQTYYGSHCKPHFKYGIYRCYLSRYKNIEKSRWIMDLPKGADISSPPEFIVPTQTVYYSNVRRSNDEAGLNLDW